jgi:signal transduction histidine kinase/CheY-like chemotaxis protein
VTGNDFAQLLTDRKDVVVARFASEVERKDLSPAGLSRSLLINHIPRFLDEIIAELRSETGVRFTQDAIDTSIAARRHGEQRWTLGFDLEALIREYGILRHCILEEVRTAGAALTIPEFDVLAKCLSVGVAEAAMEYIKYRDRQFDATRAHLEFLSEAGQLLSSSLDYGSTLNRLTGLMVPRLADFCIVAIEGSDASQMPIAHVDAAKVEIARNVHGAFRLPAGDTHTLGQVGGSILVRDVDDEVLKLVAQTPDQLALLKHLGLQSWMVVPLYIQATSLGALVLGYTESGRHYDEHDLTLANEVARRAAAAIDNASLFEQSQRERSRVEAATRAKDEFVAMVSHELRTPLNAILGWTRVMRGSSFPEEKRSHVLEVIERNASAQSRLVEDLLDVSRALTGKIRINPSQVDLANVVELAVEVIRPALDAKRIELETRLETTSSLMRGDGDRLQQVVWNLLANSVKFTPKSGKIMVTLRRVGSDLELVVKDTGEGISQSFLPLVFESFRQSDTSSSRPHGGLGIGLSIAKHIVELHGGAIDAESPGIGRGATFTVRLPISPLVSTTLGVSRVPATKPPPADVARSSESLGIRVLVVDDEPDARELVTYLLETSGMEVRTAESVADAMDVLLTYLPHVIVSDVGMADEDGYEFIRRIRTAVPGDMKNTPAIALTAFASKEDRTRALVAGFNLHMGKPVEPAVLVRAVRELAGHPRNPPPPTPRGTAF